MIDCIRTHCEVFLSIGGSVNARWSVLPLLAKLSGIISHHDLTTGKGIMIIVTSFALLKGAGESSRLLVSRYREKVVIKV